MTVARSSKILTLLLALPLAVMALGARAEVPADSKAVLTQRFDDLGKHFHGGQLARWSNPEDRSALEKVWDVPTVLGRPPYSSRDARLLALIVKAEVELLEKYVGAGGAKPGTPKETRVREKYQDEIVRNSAFLVTASAATLEAIGDVVAGMKPEDRKPATLKGLEQGRHGVRNILVGLGAELRSKINTENKAVLLDAYAANAPTIAAYSPDADRKSYAEAAKTLLPSLSEPEKAKLQVFISAMDTKDCKGLCALKG